MNHMCQYEIRALFLPGGKIGLPARFIQVVALAVDDNGERQILHGEPAHCLRAKVVIGDHLRCAHALGKQRACAADRAEVNRAVLFHGFHHGGGRACPCRSCRAARAR